MHVFQLRSQETLEQEVLLRELHDTDERAGQGKGSTDIFVGGTEQYRMIKKRTPTVVFLFGAEWMKVQIKALKMVPYKFNDFKV